MFLRLAQPLPDIPDDPRVIVQDKSCGRRHISTLKLSISRCAVTRRTGPRQALVFYRLHLQLIRL